MRSSRIADTFHFASDEKVERLADEELVHAQIGTLYIVLDDKSLPPQEIVAKTIEEGVEYPIPLIRRVVDEGLGIMHVHDHENRPPYRPSIRLQTKELERARKALSDLPEVRQLINKLDM